MALVSDDQRHTFYAKREPLPGKPTDFVQRVVYPLLLRGDATVADVVFTRQLRKFIDEVTRSTEEKPRVAFDYEAERRFFHLVYSGFSIIVRQGCAPVSYLLVQAGAGLPGGVRAILCRKKPPRRRKGY